MNLLKRMTYMTLGALLVLALVVAAAATFAQDDSDATPVPDVGTEEESGDGVTPAPNWAWPGRHRSPGWAGGPIGDDDQLAEALGITVEELQAAREEARVAAIEQAVADGLITQEQADQLLENGIGGHGLRFGAGHDTFLADALGISIDELQAARQEVRDEAVAAWLDEMVAAGVTTQEQADLISARRAVQEYVDVEALQAAIQAAYEEAVAQALADGAITQEQADQLLSEQAFGFRGFGDGFRGHGRGGFKGFGGLGPVAPAPDEAPGTTDSNGV